MLRLLLGAICIGFAPIFVKLVTIGPTMTGFYRCFFGALILFLIPQIAATKKNSRSQEMPRAAWRFAMLAGVLFALDLYVWHRSVLYAGASYGTILANTQVFYVSLVGILIYKELPGPSFYLAVLVTFVGIWLLVAFHARHVVSERYWEGILLGAFTGIVYASYILSMRQVERRRGRIPLVRIFGVVSLVTALCLLVIALFEGSFRLPEKAEWGWLLQLALISQVLGWLFITESLPKVPASRAALALLGQPLVATLMGSLLFRETLGLVQWVGAALALTGICLGSLNQPRVRI